MPTEARRHRPATERFLLSRRTALGGLVIGAAALTSGCGLLGGGPAVPVVSADPLEPLVTEKQALFDQYVAIIAAHSGLANRLGPLRDAHRQHRDALLELLDARRRAALARATPPVPTSGSVSPQPDSADGGSADSALVVLRGAERAASASTRAACLQVIDPPAQGDVSGVSERVVVLGSIAAAEASHQVALA